MWGVGVTLAPQNNLPILRTYQEVIIGNPKQVGSFRVEGSNRRTLLGFFREGLRRVPKGLPGSNRAEWVNFGV